MGDTNLFSLLYADDTILLAESVKEMQQALNGLSSYCKKKKLVININKTKVIVFSRGKIRTKPLLYLEGKLLEVAYDYVYLGIKVNFNGKFKKAIKHLYDTASRAMFVVLKKGSTLQLDFDTTLQLFDSTVVPILLYGSEVWGFTIIDLVERLHLRFLKLLLKIRKSTPNCMVYGETGRFPLDIVIKCRLISYWYKCINGDKQKWSFHMYTIMHTLCNDNIMTCKWITFVQHTFNSLGLNYIWNSQGAGISLQWLKGIIKQTCQDQYRQKWSADVDLTSKCLSYRIFKHELCFERYLIDLPISLRIPMIKFRCRNNKLPIELGSYFNIPRETRCCTKCNLDVLGDEFHVLFVCPFFHKERKLFLEPEYLHVNSVLKLNKLLNTKGETLVNVSRLIKHIMKNL